MLLITRRTDESIIINGTIEVKIVEVKGGRVKLGFEYPEGNTIYRQELYDKIMAENRQAVANLSNDKLGSFLKNIAAKPTAEDKTEEKTSNGETPHDI